MLHLNCTAFSQSESSNFLIFFRRRRRAYVPTSDTASHDDRENINSWIPMSMELRYENASSFDAKQVLIVETAEDVKNKWNSQVKQE